MFESLFWACPLLLVGIVLKVGDGWAVFSEDGKKRLSRIFKRKEDAVKRLKQIEYFKNAKDGK